MLIIVLDHRDFESIGDTHILIGHAGCGYETHFATLSLISTGSTLLIDKIKLDIKKHVQNLECHFNNLNKPQNTKLQLNCHKYSTLSSGDPHNSHLSTLINTCISRFHGGHSISAERGREGGYPNSDAVRDVA